MYVCVCNQITDRQIREAARQGCRRLEDLQRCLGVATNCGCCAELAHELLEETSAPAGPSPSPLPQPA